MHILRGRGSVGPSHADSRGRCVRRSAGLLLKRRGGPEKRVGVALLRAGASEGHRAKPGCGRGRPGRRATQRPSRTSLRTHVAHQAADAPIAARVGRGSPFLSAIARPRSLPPSSQTTWPALRDVRRPGPPPGLACPEILCSLPARRFSRRRRTLQRIFGIPPAITVGADNSASVTVRGGGG